MTFGGQTVGFVTVTFGTPDVNGVKPVIRTQVNVPGCHFRPLRSSEKVGVLNVAAEAWKCTAPPDAVVLAADAVDELIYDGTEAPVATKDTTYRLIGAAMPYTDLGSSPVKVTVMCEKAKG